MNSPVENKIHAYHSFRGKKILVTGASGFIGSHLCSRLQKGGAEVHGMSRISRSPSEDGPRWWFGDLCDISTVRNLFGKIKPDFIFHLASYVMGSHHLENVLPTFHGNLQTTVNLLTTAAEFGCQRIILTSSLAEPEPGQANPVPWSPYAAAKSAASGYARMFHALYHLPVVIMRVFMVYGPGQRDSSKLIPYVIQSLLRQEAPSVSSGQHQVDWIYVDDVVDGFLAAAQAPDVEGDTLDLGSAMLVSIGEIVRRLVALVNPAIHPLFGALPDRPMEPIRVANIAHAYSRIGWKPAVPLELGLERTVEWYRRQLERESEPEEPKLAGQNDRSSLLL